MAFGFVVIGSIIFASYHCGYETAYYRNQEMYQVVKNYAILLEEENHRLNGILRNRSK